MLKIDYDGNNNTQYENNSINLFKIENLNSKNKSLLYKLLKCQVTIKNETP